MIVKVGGLWSDGKEKEFRVIDVVELEGNTWVHYINERTGQEHSCYKESFTQRFLPIVNRH